METNSFHFAGKIERQTRIADLERLDGTLTVPPRPLATVIVTTRGGRARKGKMECQASTNRWRMARPLTLSLALAPDVWLEGRRRRRGEDEQQQNEARIQTSNSRPEKRRALLASTGNHKRLPPPATWPRHRYKPFDAFFQQHIGVCKSKTDNRHKAD